jgi:DNA-binding NarL/FixJ family response regulator
MLDGPRPLSILYRGHALAEALAAGLSSRGWRPDTTKEVSVGESRDRPVLLVEDDFGDLPDTALAMASRIASRQPVVAVAGPAALAALVRAVVAGATAINADQPYRRLLTIVDAALAGAPTTVAQHERLLTDLRQRAEEAGRFRELTAGECAVLASIAAGLSAESIASVRSVGLSTVRSQIASVLRKLDVRSQTAAVSLIYKSCADNRIIDPLTQFHQNYR